MKPKTCKVCRVKFTPDRPMQVVCNGACAISLAVSKSGKEKKVAAVKERRETKARREKIKTRAEWMKDAQTAVNTFVRTRDADKPCISCGRHHTGQYHAGHYRSVSSAPHLRLDADRNIRKQCQPCNTHLHGNLLMYRKALIDQDGLQAVEALESDQDPRRHTIDELKAIKAEYTAKTKQLLEAA